MWVCYWWIVIFFCFHFWTVLFTRYRIFLNVDPVFSLELFQLEICIILILFLYTIGVVFFLRVLLRFSFYYAFEEYKYDAFWWCFFHDSLLVVCCWVSWICGLSDLQIWKILFIQIIFPLATFYPSEIPIKCVLNWLIFPSSIQLMASLKSLQIVSHLVGKACGPWQLEEKRNANSHHFWWVLFWTF